MKGPFLLSLIFITSAAIAQQPGIESFPIDTTQLFYGNQLSENYSLLHMKQPEIKLDDRFYTIVQAPNVEHRYTKGNLLIKRPEFIPEMPVAPEKPFSDFYLLDLDMQIIPSKEE